MTKFVYVSDDYRRAWEIYINNSQGLEHWEEFDDDFKIVCQYEKKNKLVNF